MLTLFPARRCARLPTTSCSTPRAARRIAFAIARARGVAVGDHGQPAQAQQVGAAVGVRVEAGPQSARGRADQEAAELAARVAVISSRSASSSVEIVPSSSFRTMFPVKPSQTTTSAAPAAGRGPRRCRRSSSARRRRAGRAPRASAGCPSPPPRRSRAGAPRARDVEHLLAKTGAHVRELEQVLGPRVGVRARVEQHRGPVLAGITTAIAGRATPAGGAARGSRRPASRRCSLPRRPHPLALPTARQAATSELSGLPGPLGRLLVHRDLLRRLDQR